MIYTPEQLESWAGHMGDVRIPLDGIGLTTPDIDASKVFEQAAAQARVIAEMQAWLDDQVQRTPMNGEVYNSGYRVALFNGDDELSRLLRTHGLSEPPQEQP